MFKQPCNVENDEKKKHPLLYAVTENQLIEKERWQSLLSVCFICIHPVTVLKGAGSWG